MEGDIWKMWLWVKGAQTTCLGKILFLSYGPKSCIPIIVQHILELGYLKSWGIKLNRHLYK